MAPALLWLAACLCAAGAALALTLAVPRALGSRTREIVRVREARRQQDLEELFIRGVSARQVEGMAAVGAGVLGLVVGLSTGSLVLALGCGAVALFAPAWSSNPCAGGAWRSSTSSSPTPSRSSRTRRVRA